MLFIVLSIAFFAVANAAHITTVKEVDHLLDQLVKDVQRLKRIKIPGLTAAEITGIEHLKRNGNCAKTAEEGKFLRKVTATEAVAVAEGEKVPITLHVTFTIVVDKEGQLIDFRPEDIEIIPNEIGFYVNWKKVWNTVKPALAAGAKAAITEAAKVATEALIKKG